MTPNNIFDNIPATLPNELLQTLWQKQPVRIERIVSKGHSTAPEQWYDQDSDEWILLIQGRATLELEDGHIINLVAGDYLLLAAHQKHRVNWTDPATETIWLAIHINT